MGLDDLPLISRYTKSGLLEIVDIAFLLYVVTQ